MNNYNKYIMNKQADLKIEIIIIISVLLLVLIIKILRKQLPKDNILNKYFDSFLDVFHWQYKGYIFIVTLLVSFIVLIIYSVFFDIQYNSSIVNNNGYDNNHIYRNSRELEYIGGINVYDSGMNNIKRWYPLYIDVNTKEILKGANIENYLTAGYCKVGIDKTPILGKRNTKEKFISYILDYTGGILFDNDSLDLPNYYYGVNYVTEDYNKPIDIVVDINWNTNKEYKNNDKYLISTISNIDKKSINSSFLESDGKLTENEYILNILRNCFGYISDDFYDLMNNKNSFSEINITEVRIGDVGCFYDKNNKSCFGMCIGYDKDKNPIFTICTSSSKIKNRALNDYSKSLKEQNEIGQESGFNVLLVEKINRVKIFSSKNIFEKYYHTNLPFIDNNLIADNKNNNYVVENIDIYNEQVYYRNYLKQGKWDGNDLDDMVYKERIDRIVNREKLAEEIAGKYGINLSKFNNRDIQEMNGIYELNTLEYQKFINRYKNADKQKYEEKYSKEFKQKQMDEQLEKRKKRFVDSLKEYEIEMKSKSIKDVMKLYEEKNEMILSDIGKQIIIEYYNEVNDK